MKGGKAPGFSGEGPRPVTRPPVETAPAPRARRHPKAKRTPRGPRPGPQYGQPARLLINRDSTFVALLAAAQSPAAPTVTLSTRCQPWSRPIPVFESGSVSYTHLTLPTIYSV